MATKSKANEEPKQEKVVSESTLKKLEMSTKERIAQAPKVMVIIAPDAEDPMWRCTINGVKYKFPKGQIIEVPEPIAAVIRNSTRMQEIKAAHEKALVDHINLGSM